MFNEKQPISPSLDENISNIKSIFGETADLLITSFLLGDVKCSLVCFDGMLSTQLITQQLLNPITSISGEFHGKNADEIFTYIDERMIMTTDKSYVTRYAEIVKNLMNGFAILIIDSNTEALSFAVQGGASRAVAEPANEGNITGARDGFVEGVFINMSLVRRRLKSPLLKFEILSAGKTSNTNIMIAYMSDRTPEKLVKSVKEKIEKSELESILGSGYLKPYLEDSKLSFFSGVSVTERPDVFASKLLEGRLGIIIDGSPFCITLPSLFIENFQTLDDYNFRPYYATYVRWIRYAAFFTAIFLPALYVAVTMFHPELFNSYFVMSLAAAEEVTPLPLVVETLFVLLAFEVIKEAGLRLPKSVGGAVSLVGGLLIGDAAISAGLITKPLLLAVAIAVTSSFVIPSLNQPVTLLRLIAVVAGGVAGLYGVALVAAVMLVNICSLENHGVPVTSPLSPFTAKAMRDVFTRIGFKKMAAENVTVENLNGVNICQKQ